MQNYLYQKITIWTCTETVRTLLRDCLANGGRNTAYVFSIVILERINILVLKTLSVIVVLYYWYHKP